VVRRERPDLQILTCHDEYLLHTMFDVDGALVGYGCLAPEPLIEMIRPRTTPRPAPSTTACCR
jgi:4-hydroxy-tetrahydrodipicolinate synthase